MYEVVVWSVNGKGQAVVGSVTRGLSKRQAHDLLLFKYGYNVQGPLTGLKTRIISKIGKTYNITTS